MGYNVQIKVKNAQDLHRIAGAISSLMEQSTGEKAEIKIIDKRRELKRQNEEMNKIKGKLYK